MIGPSDTQYIYIASLDWTNANAPLGSSAAILHPAQRTGCPLTTLLLRTQVAISFDFLSRKDNYEYKYAHHATPWNATTSLFARGMPYYNLLI